MKKLNKHKIFITYLVCITIILYLLTTVNDIDLSTRLIILFFMMCPFVFLPIGIYKMINKETDQVETFSDENIYNDEQKTDEVSVLKDNFSMLENLKLNEQNNQKLKLKKEGIKDYFAFSTSNLCIIDYILNMPLYYSEIFDASIANLDSYDIVTKLLDELLLTLPDDFTISDLNSVSNIRKTSKLFENLNSLLKPGKKIISDKYCMTCIHNQQYAKEPNYNILDETDTFLCFPDIYCNFTYMSNHYIKNKSEIIDNLKTLYSEVSNNSSKYMNPINLLEEYEMEISYEVLHIYYNHALLILYFIAYSREVQKFKDTSELYTIYTTLKKEIHNDSYIFEKIYSLYSSLYTDSFSEILSNEELEIAFSLIEENNSLCNDEITNQELSNENAKKEIFNLYYEDFLDIPTDELPYKISEYYRKNISKYKSYLSFDDILNILYNDFTKAQQEAVKNINIIKASKEKERILNGHFEVESNIKMNMLDYSNVTNGYEFEKYVSNLYSELGYTIINITSKSGDQGADIVAEKDNQKFVIQVKFYSTPVGNKAVQEIVAAKSLYKSDKAIVVTNNTYTKSAFELAKANDVILIDGNKIKYYIDSITKNNSK